MAMRRIFWGFCRNWFLMSPLHYLSGLGPFRFWLQIRGDIRIRKTTPRYQWYGESPTPRITDTRSRQLHASLIRRVGDSPHHRYGESAIEFYKRKLSVLMMRRVGESATLRITDRESWRLRLSLSRESLFKEKINRVSIFRIFNG